MKFVRQKSQSVKSSDTWLQWNHVTPPLSSSLVPVDNKISLCLSGFPDQMSSLDTDDPTQGSNRTNVKCVRRSLPGVTTCLNTSKSTVFRESAEQFAQQIYTRLRSHIKHTYSRPTGARCEDECRFLRLHQWRNALFSASAVCDCSNLLYKCWPMQSPSCEAVMVVVAVGMLSSLCMLCPYQLPQHTIRLFSFSLDWLLW